ncbi:MAG: hypothetical protein ACR65O_05240 [Methylomicrobium sp.]
MTHHQFATNIEKTGFVLENRIAQQLKAGRWTVISNKYYVDDAEETVREIDLVAYQATRVQHFDVYTTLIISCKKSESNLWALLSRDIDLKDPNSDWYPLHVWSNDKALLYQHGMVGYSRRYHNEVCRLGVSDALKIPDVEVFAFQEMNKTSGAPQNDKNIFSAITSLMKAQSYETGALPQRKKSPAVYQFNLLSIVDSDLLRLQFTSDNISAEPIESEHYIARYIIRKRETFSRIRFLRADSFSAILADYERLHRANCKWFDSECNTFYADILTDPIRTDTLLEDFQKEVARNLSWILERHNQKGIQLSSIFLFWDNKKNLVSVYAPFGHVGTQLLNSNEQARRHVTEALEKIYRYTGQFEFEDDDIPF